MRKFFLNAPMMKLRRRELRKNHTKEELALWYQIKNKRLGYRFVRQYSVGNYVADFCCPKKRLIIELDGGQHNDQSSKEHDKDRTKYLEAFGMKVIRFWNGEIIKEMENVIRIIWDELHKSDP